MCRPCCGTTTTLLWHQAGADFDRYDAAVADEYKAVVPGFIYRFKRKHFLRELLASPRIFLSDYGHARWDAAARDNLRRALSAA